MTIINLTYGVYFALGAFAALWSTQGLGLPIWAALPVGDLGAERRRHAGIEEERGAQRHHQGRELGRLGLAQAVMGVINLTYGVYFALGAFAALWSTQGLGLPIWAALTPNISVKPMAKRA
jgi:branched-subunit amino acid ABC-type transport system permease component